MPTAPTVDRTPDRPEEQRQAATARATRPSTGNTTQPATHAPGQTPALPHERDQGATPATGARGPGPVDPVMAQAHHDIVSGQVDTDLRATAGLDAARRDKLVPPAR
jgi:hypothetical protein